MVVDNTAKDPDPLVRLVGRKGFRTKDANRVVLIKATVIDAETVLSLRRR
jgi:hypothetical protein